MTAVWRLPFLLHIPEHNCGKLSITKYSRQRRSAKQFLSITLRTWLPQRHCLFLCELHLWKQNNYQTHDFGIHWLCSPFIEPYWAAFIFNEATDSFRNSNDWEANLTEDDIKEYRVQSGTLQILSSTACCHINWKNPQHVTEFCSLCNMESLLVSSRPPIPVRTNVYKGKSEAAMIMWESFVLRLEGLQIMFESGRHKPFFWFIMGNENRMRSGLSRSLAAK